MHSLTLALKALRPAPLAPVLGLTHIAHLLALPMAALLWAFASFGEPKPLLQWRWVDIAGEGGMGVMAAIWLFQLRLSRPGGRVTDLLCLGLAAMMLGQWVDVLDEFWHLPKAIYWDNWLESSLNPLGALLLTLGLHHWRLEQRALTEQLLKRERLFREHRSMDGITQLGDAAYLQAQIALEQRMQRPGALLMLSLDGFDTVTRELGLAESDRLLQAASHLLLLNLHPEHLLCRFAADRFCVLMPGADSDGARLQAEHLQQALNGLAHHSRGGQRLQLRASRAWAPLDASQPPEQQLLSLNARLMRTAR
ncbi:GGDEF domain-containing protein [Roseateles oligotrophus]|uniref:diguanylate cyclase n=1 Tax=Roseateles oligotrophus TaxID=1769250 RepID=A0ABT2YD26_9BURK|nr:diguanylate cyclase [Roseateles oligotrophus]MCV2367949.1 diguanylate cyclase [Roseateles oligotrophus]